MENFFKTLAAVDCICGFKFWEVMLHTFDYHKATDTDVYDIITLLQAYHKTVPLYFEHLDDPDYTIGQYKEDINKIPDIPDYRKKRAYPFPYEGGVTGDPHVLCRQYPNGQLIVKLLDFIENKITAEEKSDRRIQYALAEMLLMLYFDDGIEKLETYAQKKNAVRNLQQSYINGAAMADAVIDHADYDLKYGAIAGLADRIF